MSTTAESNVPPPRSSMVTGVDAGVLEAQRMANAELRKMPHPDPRTSEGLAELRALIAPPQRLPQLTPEDVLVDRDSGKQRLHIFTPKGAAQGVMVRIHGGGWVGGAPEDDEALNDHLCRRCRLAIVSPEYRLAPDGGITVVDEVEDCLAAVRWAYGEAQQRFGTARLLLGGTSGGAHLASLVLLALRDAGDPAFGAIEAIHLDSGPYDVSGTPSQRLATDNTLVVTPMWLNAFRELAFPGRGPEALRDPAVSPLYADLSGLPPAMFVVGALDPLVDDSLFMAARWQAAGNPATVEVRPEAAHTFMNMGTPLADAALAHSVAWISTSLAQEEGMATDKDENLAPGHISHVRVSAEPNVGVRPVRVPPNVAAARERLADVGAGTRTTP
jgi:acetyl esterase